MKKIEFTVYGKKALEIWNMKQPYVSICHLQKRDKRLLPKAKITIEEREDST